jgi:MFS family permease
MTGRQGLYKGWRMVVMSCLFNVLNGGLYHWGLSLYFLPLIRTFEVSHTKLSFAFSMRQLEGGMEGPIVGYLVDRIGPRFVVLAGIVMGGIGFILLGMTQTFLSFVLVFLGVLAIGFSAPNNGLMATINFWFRRRLGTAMSLASTGMAIGGFLVTPLVAWILLNHSWRTAAMFSGVATLAIGVPLALLVRKPRGDEAAVEEKPSSMVGVHGLGGTDPAPGQNACAKPADFKRDYSVREALHTKVFWMLALAIGLRLMAQSALTVHMVPMLVSKSIGEGTAAILVSVAALVRLPGLIGGGLLADRWARSKASAVAMASGVVAVSCLHVGPSSALTGTVFAIFFAVAESCNAVTWALIGEFFGRCSFGSLRGIVSFVQSSMSFIGPIMAGFVYDTTGNYRIVFIVLGTIYTLSAILFWVMEPPAALQPQGSARDLPAEASPEK